MEGFTYNGVHSDDMKVIYVPDASARGDFFADYEMIDMEKSWNDGGECYKPRIKSRKKELDCYYEDITIAEKERILRWLDCRTNGELIFDDRPYAMYRVCPTKKIEFKDYLQSDGEEKLYSGTFTITFTAYDPFADLIWDTLDDHEYDERVIEETGLIPSSFMPPAITADTIESMAETKQVIDGLIYNPGTEKGHSIIRFAGKTGSTDLRIYNAANGGEFVLKAGLETSGNEYIECLSETGRILRVGEGNPKVDFAWHDEGYITFEPFGSIVRDVLIITTAGSRNIMGGYEIFDDSMVGKYIYANGKYRDILEVISPMEILVSTPLEVTTAEISLITSMNYITITKAADAEISRLEIICKPEVR